MTSVKRPRLRRGDWIAIPLSSGGIAVGYVTGVSPDNKLFVGYLSGKRFEIAPSMNEVAGLRPEHAIVVSRVSSYAIADGHCSIIGYQPVGPEWAMPEFRRRNYL